jgi:dTDP-4-dehydrorhamnose 3,5-epimerase
VKPDFQELAIKGVWQAPLVIYQDRRGWLCEVFRADWSGIAGIRQPVMGYVSSTLPGMVRGPHEHRQQTDWFVFAGPSDFLVVLWDNRTDSPTAGRRLELKMGAGSPGMLIVPPGVVHAYKNIGHCAGLVLNFPDRLYRGLNRQEAVDEIRYEEQADHRFWLE